MKKVQHGNVTSAPPSSTTSEEPTKKMKTKEKSKPTCLVCCNDIEFYNIYESCDHEDICYKCSLSMRVLLDDNTCCICKTPSERVIITQSQPKTFQEYKLKELKHDKEWNIYLENDLLLDKIRDLRDVKCRICEHEHANDEIPFAGSFFSNMHQLKTHVTKEHHLHYCILCLENRKVFLKEQKLYHNRDITNHLRFGENDAKHGRINGHPLCKFCNKRFYDDDQLFQHMYKRHETCHICERNGIQFEYFKDYPHLESHFESLHYVCKDPICMEKKFVVFSNELDLKAHELKEHVNKNKKLSRKEKEKYTRIDLGSASGLQPAEGIVPQRRPLRVGEVNSSVIRFVDSGGDGYYNDPPPREERYHRNKGGRSSRFGDFSQHSAFGNGSSSSNVPVMRIDPASGSSSSNSVTNVESIELKKEKGAALVKRMKEALGSREKYEEFRKLSQDFQKGLVLASDYYESYIQMFGDEQGRALFTDMVSVMPDKDERRKSALSMLHQQYLNKELIIDMNKKSKPLQSNNSSSSSSVKDDLEEQQELWPSLDAAAKSRGRLPNSAGWGAVDQDVVRRTLKKKEVPKGEDFPTLGGKSGGRALSSSSSSVDSGVWGGPPARAVTAPKKNNNNNNKKKETPQLELGNGMVVLKKKSKK
ncbi:hypothetical protein AKO1_014439 [Acrasis kona]|uniref:C2H2-type domain-containing protein n=1 Tax=Acrasis kona TaxID=1008807 RepID=A0AAW2YYH7_9EUKA